jgi:hypothetical protein
MDAPIRRLRSSLYPTIFHEDWWLDICGDFRTVSVEREDGTPIAMMPYSIEKRFGLTFCRPPPLIHFSGPGFAAMDGPPQGQVQRRNDLTRDLIAKLPPCDFFEMKLHFGITDTLAFQREGFKTTVQFTYEINPEPTEQMLSRIRRGHRRMIKEAQSLYTVDAFGLASEFVAAYADNVVSAGQQFRYDSGLLTRLIDACLCRDQGQVFFARDASGAINAGLFVMWDDNRMYNFMATRVQKGVESNASVLLLWAAIQEANKRKLIFDFDGVFNAGQVQFFSGFGGHVSPRYIISRTTKITGLACALLEVTKGHFRDAKKYLL